MNIAKIGIIGDFNESFPTHIATNEALRDSGTYLGIKEEHQWLGTESIAENPEIILDKFDGFLCAPGSPYKSMEGALKAIRFARENDRPFLGTCGGFQHTVLEYARDVLHFEDAQHEEYNPYASKLFISALTCSLAGKILKISLVKNSRAYKIYGRTTIEERYYCNFGLNPKYQQAIHDGGLKITGTDDTKEARILEIPEKRFFFATLFVPQTSSSAEHPHVLINEFLNHACKFNQKRNSERLPSDQ